MERPKSLPAPGSESLNSLKIAQRVLNLDKAQRIRELMTIYMTTRDTAHLDNAIELCRELAYSDENAEPMLATMLQLQERHKLQGVLRGDNALMLRSCLPSTPPGGASRDKWASATSPNSSLECTQRTKNRETAEIITMLHDTFTNTGDKDSLDNAIALATDLAFSDKDILPRLKKLLELQYSQPACLDNANRTQVDEQQDGTEPRTIAKSLECTKNRVCIGMIKILRDIFTATRDKEYLNLAMVEAADLPYSGKDTLPLIQELLELLKSQPTGPENTEQVQVGEPQNTTETGKCQQNSTSNDRPLPPDSNTLEHNHNPKNSSQTPLLSQELDETLAIIRRQSGFEEFQCPSRSQDLMAIASGGSIVIINSTELQSDAIIITSTRIKALLLPSLSYTTVQQWMSEIPQLVSATGRPSTYARRNKRMELLLLWLWDVAVDPVLKELSYQLDGEADPRLLPKIWWIGGGLLATAPFHAAGDHSRGSTRNTLSQAISSYLPTIQALSYAREKKLELPDSQLLLVTMPKTPGKGDLRNSLKEVDKIAEIAAGMTKTTLRLNCPSTAQVLAELPSYHAVHFACHGLSDAENPSGSHLLLCKDDGSEPGTVDKLTIGMLSDTNAKHAQIAYLSACCTAQNTSDPLDEPIYIASGFQLAGFSHVLATQWYSEDDACLQVASDFYGYLFRGKTKARQGPENHRIVSESFHRAVKTLRDANRRQPIKWAPFIHTGA